jgi:hypothetical protein
MLMAYIDAPAGREACLTMGTVHGYTMYEYAPDVAGKGKTNPATAMATVGQDIFKPTKFGGKYTVTLIPGTPP